MSTPDTRQPETATPANEGPSFLDAVVGTESNVGSPADENPPDENDDDRDDTVAQKAVRKDVDENDTTNNDIDIESQQGQLQTEPQQLSPSPKKPQSNDDPQQHPNEDDTASLFSFDSYEKQPRIPLRLQNLLKRKNNNNSATNDPGSSNTVPFPSVINRDAPQDQGGSGGRLFLVGQDVDVPCRCLFFTVKETICMVLSALGCAVFLCGLILLCMYLEGSIFVDND